MESFFTITISTESFILKEWERPLVEAALSAAVEEARNSLLGSQFIMNRLPPPPPPLPLPGTSDPRQEPPVDPRLVPSSAAAPRQAPPSEPVQLLKSCRGRKPTPGAYPDGEPLSPLDTGAAIFTIAAAPSTAAAAPDAAPDGATADAAAPVVTAAAAPAAIAAAPDTTAACVVDAAVAAVASSAAAAAAAAPLSPVLAPGGTRAPVVLPPSSLAWRSLVKEATDTVVSERAAEPDPEEPPVVSGAEVSPVLVPGSAGAPIEVESSPSAPPPSSSYHLRPRLHPEKSPDCIIIKHKNPAPPSHKKVVWGKKEWEGYQAFLDDLAKPQEKPQEKPRGKVNKKNNKKRTNKNKKNRKGKVLPNGDLVVANNREDGTLIEIGGGRPGDFYKEEEDEAFSADSDDSSYSP